MKNYISKLVPIKYRNTLDTLGYLLTNPFKKASLLKKFRKNLKDVYREILEDISVKNLEDEYEFIRIYAYENMLGKKFDELEYVKNYEAYTILKIILNSLPDSLTNKQIAYLSKINLEVEKTVVSLKSSCFLSGSKVYLKFAEVEEDSKNIEYILSKYISKIL